MILVLQKKENKTKKTNFLYIKNLIGYYKSLNYIGNSLEGLVKDLCEDEKLYLDFIKFLLKSHFLGTLHLEPLIGQSRRGVLLSQVHGQLTQLKNYLPC